MSLGKTFTNSIVREIGRNYGKSISNSLLGNTHSTPVRVVNHLGHDTGGRNYKNKLEKICNTWTIKGPTATFNVAQNIHLAFFDLVEEANADNNIDLSETVQLMKSFEMAHKELVKIVGALRDLGKDDLASKADELDDRFFMFFVDLNKEFVLPERPTGIFRSKQKKNWDYASKVKDNIQQWVDAYENEKNN